MAPPTSRRRNKNITFQYDGTDNKKAHISGEISGVSVAQARAELEKQGIVVLNIKKKSFSFSLFAKKPGSVKGTNIKAEDATLFTRQVATMLTAGIPLVQALGILIEGSENPKVANLITDMKADIESGSNFSSAVKKFPNNFDHLYCSLIEAAEQSGTLDKMMAKIASYQEKSQSLKKKIKKAMIYPIAVVCVAIIVSIILLVKVVPTFQEMFKSFNAELPAFTQMILNLSTFIQKYGLEIAVVTGFLIYSLIAMYKKNVTFRNAVQRMAVKIPVFGSLIEKTAIARFASTLATTSAAGVPLTEALDGAAQSTGNIVFSSAILNIKEWVAQGKQIRASMKKTGVFPVMVVQMIGIGEESGALEEMLNKVAKIYEEEVDVAVDGLTSLMEPLIMALLGVMVGGLVIAMYLPIFKMGSVV